MVCAEMLDAALHQMLFSPDFEIEHQNPRIEIAVGGRIAQAGTSFVGIAVEIRCGGNGFVAERNGVELRQTLGDGDVAVDIEDAVDVRSHQFGDEDAIVGGATQTRGVGGDVKGVGLRFREWMIGEESTHLLHKTAIACNGFGAEVGRNQVNAHFAVGCCEEGRGRRRCGVRKVFRVRTKRDVNNRRWGHGKRERRRS